MGRNHDFDNDAADAAIARVLAAESAARDEITQCRRQALAILRKARSRARSILRRTDRRIIWVHTLSDTALNRTLGSIAGQTQALSATPQLTPELTARLDRAIDRLIDEILA